jgi:putative addiction module CopG family antidote
MDGIALPPDLEQFAAEAVAAGHYRDTAEVVRAGVELLRRRELGRAALLASVLAAREEADRSGYLTGDEVAAHVRETIARKTGAAA